MLNSMFYAFWCFLINTILFDHLKKKRNPEKFKRKKLNLEKNKTEFGKKWN